MRCGVSLDSTCPKSVSGPSKFRHVSLKRHVEFMHISTLNTHPTFHSILTVKGKENRFTLKMRSTKVVLLLVLFFTVCVGTCRPWVEDAKTKAEGAKQFAGEDKFSKSFGAEDAAKRTTGTMKSAATGASEYASEKATDAKEAISGAMAHGRDKTYEAYEGAAKVIKMPTDSINDVKDKMGETVADTYEDAKQRMYTASDKASSMAHNAKDNMAESIGQGYDLGKEKINMASEKFYDAKEKASDVYDESRHKISDTVSDNANDASERIYDVKNKVKGAMHCGGHKAVDAFDEAMERMTVAGDKANDAKEKMGVRIIYGRDKVAETFDQAQHDLAEAYASAKNIMTEEAKTKYEAAKEKASDATGDIGAKMRNTPNV
ncbi:uncharacterized protein LOC109800963 [Cajanus cajan]|uniref:uncharacterized protein LOC109800963 n=1 Tax=Cajanus cajan TaxID=3821 RepID=UPI0010FB9214|nr:uncharacterized protein LOC109800963 [Cajanus cajan]XP_020217493.2 uncharacterized protein LOC109800963 [Cajanus cajan]